MEESAFGNFIKQNMVKSTFFNLDIQNVVKTALYGPVDKSLKNRIHHGIISQKEAISMMGRKESQLQLALIDAESFVPENHLLKKINQQVDFKFIYDKAAPYYSKIGRPSIDPVCMIKMLIVGYLYGVKSERRLVEDISLNIAYRWFCGFELSDKIPNHSLFSQNRRRRFTDSSIFNEIFNQIIRECVKKGLVTGDAVVSDGSFIPADISEDSLVEINKKVEQSTVHYLDALDDELRSLPGYKEPEPEITEKRIITSTTDPESGYINHEHKKGLGYLTQMTTDTDNGIVIGVDCYPANQRESSILLKHITRIQTETDVTIDKLGLDAGYDVGAIHRGLELMGIEGYVSPKQLHNDILKRDLKYKPESDCFECPGGKKLSFIKLGYTKPTQSYYRTYRMSLQDRKTCRKCKHRSECQFSYCYPRINVSAFYPAYYSNRQRSETAEYESMKRLRSIWAEGAFAVLKREHNLSRTKKRGLQRVKEEFLLAALALNLKRMVKVLDRHKNWHKNWHKTKHVFWLFNSFFRIPAGCAA